MLYFQVHSSILTKFCAVGHIGPPDLDGYSKIQTFRRPRWQMATIWKTVKLTRDIPATVWPIFMKFGKVQRDTSHSQYL